jgi:hypothetical protein
MRYFILDSEIERTIPHVMEEVHILKSSLFPLGVDVLGKDLIEQYDRIEERWIITSVPHEKICDEEHLH